MNSTEFDLEEFLDDIDNDRYSVSESIVADLQSGLVELLFGMAILGTGVAGYAAKNAVSKFMHKRRKAKAAAAKLEANKRFEKLIEELSADEELAYNIELLSQLNGSKDRNARKDAKYITDQITKIVAEKAKNYPSKKVLGALMNKKPSTVKTEARQTGQSLLKEWIRIILEGKWDDIVAKNPQYSAQFEEVKKKNIHPKYFDWILKQLTKSERIESILSVVSDFEKSAQRLEVKDINRYESL